jgi:transcriptional regulator with XRE-family HTH domain
VRRKRDPEVLQQLGARLAAARSARGWTQQGLAVAVGLSEAVVVSRIEQGVRGVTLDTLLRIAKALEVPVGSLLEVAEPVPPPQRQADEVQLADRIARMTPEQRKLLLHVADEFLRRE